MAPLVRTGGSRHTGLVALPHRNIHLFTLNGENLFNTECSYKALCADCIATVHDSDIIVNIEQQFLSVASSRHTPRRFVSYNQAHLEKLKNAST